MHFIETVYSIGSTLYYYNISQYLKRGEKPKSTMVTLAHQENILLDLGTCSILVNISLLYQNVSFFVRFPNKLNKQEVNLVCISSPPLQG